ncbi:uncharacterized protein BKA78DRAFT_299151 [Phyllosticta capitalensis]|uniref:uncharacterized protein n=1 Tax=Phyllosticta capitalensis TaxID=121624 RepID=UPI00312D0C5C
MGAQVSNENFAKQCNKAARPPRCYHNLQKISRLCDKRDTMRTPVCRQLMAALYDDWAYYNGTHPHTCILPAVPVNATAPPPPPQPTQQQNNNGGGNGGPPNAAAVAAGAAGSGGVAHNGPDLQSPPPPSSPPPGESAVPHAVNGNAHIDTGIVHVNPRRSAFDLDYSPESDSAAAPWSQLDSSASSSAPLQIVAPRSTLGDDKRGVAALSLLAALALLSTVVAVAWLARRRAVTARRRRVAAAAVVEGNGGMAESGRL